MSSFIEGEDRRKDSITQKDLESLSREINLQIKLSIQELVNTMIKKEDLETLVKNTVNDHEDNCGLKHKDYLKKNDCYDAWLECKRRYDDEAMDSTIKKYQYWKAIIGFFALIGSGGIIHIVIELFKNTK